ncbi:hypothetical protein SAMN05428944_0175 [Streptomyces sp. 1222.5]|uniref:hypothetical protein n=1 Tax=unclassified Streptomyces TaxID=2593676 RepID=UPI00089999EB|nr:MULTISPECIES: hypothetical protein [unclassified Streptomyces]PKW05106.1 hypothetical protein BX260_0172 [Streptomyces sp. 5112.2]SEB54701.1 hypothetical protein SAMN05428944_0175 [Streptomyces sp. 1222.5]
MGTARQRQAGTEAGTQAEAAGERSLLPVLGVVVVLAAVLERCLSLFGGPKTYILCDGLAELSGRLEQEASRNRWALLAGLVLSVTALALSRLRRGRVLPVLMLSSVLVLVVVADDCAARADAVALQISASQTCEEPTTVYDTSRGWFHFDPFGQAP